MNVEDSLMGLKNQSNSVEISFVFICVWIETYIYKLDILE